MRVAAAAGLSKVRTSSGSLRELVSLRSGTVPSAGWLSVFAVRHACLSNDERAQEHLGAAQGEPSSEQQPTHSFLAERSDAADVRWMQKPPPKHLSMIRGFVLADF